MARDIMPLPISLTWPRCPKMFPHPYHKSSETGAEHNWPIVVRTWPVWPQSLGVGRRETTSVILVILTSFPGLKDIGFIWIGVSIDSSYDAKESALQ